MPANLPPEYKAAEAAFRKARDPRERLEWLREMLRTIPKHKGTDLLQGDVKRRIKELSEELECPQKRRRTWRSSAGHPARGRSADRVDRAAEREQVVPACTADRLRRAGCSLSLHDPASRARNGEVLNPGMVHFVGLRSRLSRQPSWTPSFQPDLLANLIGSDRRDPIPVAQARDPFHLVLASRQGRDDIAFGIVATIPKDNQVTRPD